MIYTHSVVRCHTFRVLRLHEHTPSSPRRSCTTSLCWRIPLRARMCPTSMSMWACFLHMRTFFESSPGCSPRLNHPAPDGNEPADQPMGVAPGSFQPIPPGPSSSPSGFIPLVSSSPTTTRSTFAQATATVPGVSRFRNVQTT